MMIKLKSSTVQAWTKIEICKAKAYSPLQRFQVADHVFFSLSFVLYSALTNNLQFIVTAQNIQWEFSFIIAAIDCGFIVCFDVLSHKARFQLVGLLSS